MDDEIGAVIAGVKLGLRRDVGLIIETVDQFAERLGRPGDAVLYPRHGDDAPLLYLREGLSQAQTLALLNESDRALTRHAEGDARDFTGFDTAQNRPMSIMTAYE